MINAKRLLALALVLCMGLCLCACGGGEDTTGTTAPTQGTEPTNSTTQSTAPTGSTGDGKVEYKVTVLYPDGTPVVGAWVQICLEDLCYNPAETDENGVATFRLKPMDGYKTKLAVAVEGYVQDDYIYFESGATEITINLVPVE